MKVIAYTALLYGKDYLGYAIKSIIDYVDEYHVIYDVHGHGSHGHYTDRVCPDTRWELINIASNAAGDKLRWHDAGPFAHEGMQREAIHQYAPDADVILVLDADEIWHPIYAEHARNMARDLIAGTGSKPVRRYRLPMIHYWRSFYRAVLHDPAYPERIIFPKAPEGIDTHWVKQVGDGNDFYNAQTLVINHMGYAQRSELVEFKQHTHGHKGEWRRDCDWFNDKFMANAQTDCHPVGSEYWNPESVDPWQYMPEYMKDHPYAKLEVVP